MRLVTVFANRTQFAASVGWLESAGLPFTVVSPDPGYARVGVPGVVLEEAVRLRLAAGPTPPWACAGWVEYRPPCREVPLAPPPAFTSDVLEQVAVMTLQPCLADATKLRAIAHVVGHLAEVFPYLNATMPGASYNPNGPVLTFREGYRLVSLYPWRIAVAKFDDLVDLWRVLEGIRVRANTCWQNRAALTPCFTMRERPPALKIYLHLPRTNCRACGEQTCFAFAFKVWRGAAAVSECAPVFSGEYGHLAVALEELCAGLSVGGEEE